jgi:UDP-N-acetylmuramoyl-tripeptide--D-alanyl-D-alanine ligase
MSKLRKLVNNFLPLWDFAYILQLEEYQLSRYIAQVKLRLFKRNFEQRDHLHYTGRMKLTLLGFVGLLVLIIGVLFLLQPLVGIIGLLTTPLITPYLLVASSYLVGIPTHLLRQRTLRTATTTFKQTYPAVKVIGITGSFGKTTAKYLLQHVLQYNYRVAIIPDNINTALGIADYILANKIAPNTELLIVEMGAYTQGDIAETATLLPPDLAILTIFGDQHLERFGSQANLVTAKSEIFTTNPQTVCYMTSQSSSQLDSLPISTEQLVVIDAPQGEKSTHYLVAKVASDLGVSDESIQSSLTSFIPPGRRNNIIERQGVTIIDNSYNISPMVAAAMLQAAARTATAKGKKLVVMTGGISEQGTNSPQANQNLSTLLNTYADRVLLNPSVYAEHMYQTLTIPYQLAETGLSVSEQPATWLDGETELLLWLTDHSDLAYL